MWELRATLQLMLRNARYSTDLKKKIDYFLDLDYNPYTFV